MKKGQTEIIGLVIIVILIVFIAIFALSFSIKPKQETEDILKLKASSLRSSILKTTLCEGVDIKNGIENCIVDSSTGCPTECGGLGEVIEDIIIKSLEANEICNFKIEGFTNFDFSNGNCIQPVTAVPQNIEGGVVKVSLCRR